MDFPDCEESNQLLSDARMEEVAWSNVWGKGEGWLCLASGTLQHESTSRYCCEKTRHEECKFPILAGMYDWVIVSQPDRDLIKSFDFHKVLKAILSCTSLTDKILLNLTTEKIWNKQLLNLVCPRELDSGDGYGFDHTVDLDCADEGSNVNNNTD